MISPDLVSAYNAHHYALASWLLTIPKNTCIIHIDAHLDVNFWCEERLGFYKKHGIKSMSYASEPENTSRKGLFSIEDFYYPILISETLDTFIWLKPPLFQYNTPLGTILRQLSHFKESEFFNWNIHDQIANGSLFGKNSIVVNNLDKLDIKSNYIILDIDLDYFVNQRGEMWLNPGDFLKLLDNYQWSENVKEVHVALSSDGGYTPSKYNEIFKEFIVQLRNRSKSFSKNDFMYYSDNWNDFLTYVQFNKSQDVLIEYNENKIKQFEKYLDNYLSKLGLLYYLEQNFELAKSNLESSILLNPNHYYSLYYLARIGILEKDYLKAINLLIRCHDIYPEEHKALSLLYLLKFKLKKIKGDDWLTLEKITKELFLVPNIQQLIKLLEGVNYERNIREQQTKLNLI